MLRLIPAVALSALRTFVTGMQAAGCAELKRIYAFTVARAGKGHRMAYLDRGPCERVGHVRSLGSSRIRRFDAEAKVLLTCRNADVLLL